MTLHNILKHTNIRCKKYEFNISYRCTPTSPVISSEPASNIGFHTTLYLIDYSFCSFQSLTSLNEEAEVQPCIKTSLGVSSHEADSQHSCHHLAPPRGLCSLMQNLFFSNKPQTCQHQTRVTFCATVSISLLSLMHNTCELAWIKRSVPGHCTKH